FSRGPGYTFSLMNNEMQLTLAQPSDAGATSPRPAAPRSLDVLGVHFVGANANARVTGLDELASRTNYFTGGKSIIDVPNYSKVEVHDLYPGIDAVFYSNPQGKLEYDLTAQPGASLAAVQLEFQGAAGTSLDAAGNLVLGTASGGTVVEHAPGA